MYYLRDRLQSAGFNIGQSESPIFPIMVRDNEKVYKIADMSQKFSEFVKGYDYWFSDIADKAMKSSDNPKDKFVALMDGLQEALKEKSVMQELLRWEVAEGNDTTKRTAMLREAFTLPIAEKYKALFENTCVDFVALASLLIGGLYYMNLHKERSKFCGIDMQQEEDIERMNKAIRTFAEIMFSFLERRDTKQDIAERMRAKGIDEQTIKECLQI